MKYKNKFLNLLAYNDMNGDPISFTINKQDSPKTLIGGIISTSLLLFMTVVFFLELKAILAKQNPNISSYLKLNPNPKQMNLSSESLPLAFAVLSPNGVVLNNIIKLKAQIVQANLIEQRGYNFKSIQNLTMTNCTINNFLNINQTIFQNRQLSNFICFENQNFIIDGLTTASTYKQLQLEISYCGSDYLNSSDCNIDTQKNLMKEKTNIGQIFLVVYYQNNIYDPADYVDPIKKNLDSVFIFGF